MANSENLKGKGFDSRTTEEARELGKKGGIASGESRRQRKALREELLALLSQDDIQERISLALINEALHGNSAGSVTKAFEVIRDTIGEKPVEKVQIAEVDDDMVSEVEAIVMEEDDDEE